MRHVFKRGTLVDVEKQDTFKFFPTNPPRRGEHVLVDGIRCRVTRAKVTWAGDRWTLHELRVKYDSKEGT